MSSPTRKRLHHDVPSWVDASAALFFVTICCSPRGTNQLARAEIADAITEALARRSADGVLFAYALLLMPDHLHAIVAYDDRRISLGRAIGGVKQRLARHCGIRWQKGFFDHRVRDERGYKEKVEYIARNPVEAGLCERADDWPYLWLGDGCGEAGDGAPALPFALRLGRSG